MDRRNKKELLIVKVGTNVLIDTKGGDVLADRIFSNIGREARQLSDEGSSVMLVSSGAVAAGVLGDGRNRHEVKCSYDICRYAARGWDVVLQRWKSVIGTRRVSSALLTRHELSTKSRARTLSVFGRCLDFGDIVIVNENDALGDCSLKFGDNDTLAAELAVGFAKAGMFESVKLVILTDVDGLYRDVNNQATLIRQVEDFEKIKHCASSLGSCYGCGGMVSKVRAAQITSAVGVCTYIANGRTNYAISRAINQEIGTRFNG